MKQATLVFLVRRGNPAAVLLGRKKRGFGEGKYNGFGGKIELGEDARAAAAREIHEEAELAVRPQDLVPAGRITFRFPAQPGFDHDVTLFLATRWDGEPRETDEMAPAWFPIAALPFAEMWQDDAVWLPLVLAGETVEAEFEFAADNETVSRSSVRSGLAVGEREPLVTE